MNLSGRHIQRFPSEGVWNESQVSGLTAAHSEQADEGSKCVAPVASITQSLVE